MALLWLVLLFALSILNCLNGMSYQEKGMLDRMLTYYDDKVRPNDKRNLVVGNADRPVVVNITLSINRLDFDDSVLTIDMTIGEAWYDSRLKGVDTIQEQFQFSADTRIWMPKGSPINALEEANCQNQKLIYYDSGRIQSFCRFLIKVACENNYQDFPYDKHSCRVRFQAADNDETSYLWESANQQTNGFAAPDAFSIKTNIRTENDDVTSQSPFNPLQAVYPLIPVERILPNRRLKRSSSIRRKTVRTTPAYYEYEYEPTYTIGKSVIVDISLNRSKATYYIITAIVPAVLLVVLTWIAAFTNRKSIKFTLQSTYIFALVVLWGTHNDVPELTALDVWLLCCMVFMGISIAESLLVSCGPSGYKTPTKRSDSALSINRVIVMGGDNRKEPRNELMVHVAHFGVHVRRCVQKEQVHAVFLVMYPLTFLVMSLIFWLPKTP